MIYGLNFNGTHIPAEVARHFPARINVTDSGNIRVRTINQSCDYVLVGVCQTDEEHQRMIVQATNGRRNLFTLRRSNWIAVYAG